MSRRVALIGRVFCWPVHRDGSRIFFALLAGLILLAGGTVGPAFAAPEQACTGPEGSHTRCATEVTGEAARLESVVADDTASTTAVPWSTPGVPPAPAITAGARTTDPAWDLVDSLSVYQRLDKAEHLAVEFDHVANSLIALPPINELTVLAEQAVAKSPTWLQKELEDTFSRLDASTQDTLANVILDAVDPYVDEIAWSVAHISTSDLTNVNFYTQLIQDNAELLYTIDSEVDYAQIVDYGDSSQGGDYYSTVRYKVDEGGVINEYEYDRDTYYWFIVHPRGSDELPTYIDPDAPCSGSGTPAAPPEGRFWREAFYYGMPTYFGQCDNDHDGVKDGPCPVLRDMLQQVHVLWAGLKDTPGPTNGAIGQASDWVHRILGKWGDEDGCRPIQPVTIYYWQDGNCGEFQDMQTAAGRTALIPTIGVSAHANDHVWNEFYERRWIEWQAEDRQIDHPEGHDGWTGGLAAVNTWRGDGYGWTDSTAHYSPTCQLVVTITDANGYPVDGAQVDVGSEPYNLLCDLHLYVQGISKGYTDANGQVTFILGDNNQEPAACRMYYVHVHTDWADYPSSGYTLVIDHPQPDMTYYWDHQFLEGSVPRLSVTSATEPSDPTIDNMMEVTYSVTDAYMHGSGFSTGIAYRDDMKPGDVDFFIADSANYSSYTSDASFEAYDIAEDSASGDFEFVPPATDDWYAVWSNKAVHNFTQVVNATVNLYSNNGYIPPVCDLTEGKGDAGEAILEWGDLTGINVDAYNVYRSTSAPDVGRDRTQAELEPYLLATVTESTYTDPDSVSPGVVFHYTVRTLGKSGTLANDCP